LTGFDDAFRIAAQFETQSGAGATHTAPQARTLLCDLMVSANSAQKKARQTGTGGSV
jgi:hypothetical protein